jgi:hypothetical protein
MRTKKINNIKITPLITHSKNPEDILGGKMFIDPYSNTAIISKKKSGKTTLLYHILKKVCRGGSMPTNVIIFSPTIHKDKTYEYIKEMLEKKGCNVSTYTNFIEDDENIVEGLLKSLSNEDNEEQQLKEDKPPIDTTKLSMFGKGINDIEDEPEKKIKPPKKIGAEYALIFDDLGSAMTHKIIDQLSKVLRHYKMRCFYLQQYLTDLKPATRKQIDYALLFKSFNEEKLKNIYESLDLSTNFDDFVKMYHYATEEPYNFFYIDVRDEKYRKNFDTEIILQ